MVPKLLLTLLIIAYMGLSLFGFLSGMFNEGLIGSTHPMADLLALPFILLAVQLLLSAAAEKL